MTSVTDLPISCAGDICPICAFQHYSQSTRMSRFGIQFDCCAIPWKIINASGENVLARICSKGSTYHLMLCTAMELFEEIGESNGIKQKFDLHKQFKLIIRPISSDTDDELSYSDASLHMDDFEFKLNRISTHKLINELCCPLIRAINSLQKHNRFLSRELHSQDVFIKKMTNQELWRNFDQDEFSKFDFEID